MTPQPSCREETQSQPWIYPFIGEIHTTPPTIPIRGMPNQYLGHGFICEEAVAWVTLQLESLNPVVQEAKVLPRIPTGRARRTLSLVPSIILSPTLRLAGALSFYHRILHVTPGT